MKLRFSKTGVLTPTARCPVYYRHLGKGDAALSRCIPLAADTSITPCRPRSALQIAAGVECVSATYGRCITSQAERSSSPDTPMMKGAFALPSTPSPNPMRVGCAPSYSSDGSRAGACLPLATQPLPRGQLSDAKERYANLKKTFLNFCGKPKILQKSPCLDQMNMPA